VVGIDSESIPVTVGFWIDGNCNNLGFVNVNGQFTSVVDPHTGTFNGVQTNQLLGINDNGDAVGFYNDTNGNSHGYVYDINTNSFQEIKLPFGGVVSFQVTGINDKGVICGFYSNGSITPGFVGNKGHFTSVRFHNSVNTTLLGINNSDIAVGAYINKKSGESHGLIYVVATQAFAVVNDPHASPTPAFGVTGTTVNGINDTGDLVGFYSDGVQVHGFLATPK
jgi:hypothetical protein